MLEIKKILAGALESCCYIISSRGCLNAMIIDPGENTDEIIGYLENNKLNPTVLINTHGHGDHIGGNKELKEKYPDVQICVHSDDAEMLPDPYKNLSLFGGVRYASPPADRILNHHDEIMFDKYTFRVIHLPGHTPGGIGIFADSAGNGEAPLLFSGDTLIAGGIGCTNFPRGNHDLLVRSIKNCIFALDEKTVVYPGHGSSTTVKVEKERFKF